jgi:hypothetical protein
MLVPIMIKLHNNANVKNLVILNDFDMNYYKLITKTILKKSYKKINFVDAFNNKYLS